MSIIDKRLSLRLLLLTAALLATASCSDRSVAPYPVEPSGETEAISLATLKGLPPAQGMLRGNEGVTAPVPVSDPEVEEPVPAERNRVSGVIISRSTMYRAGKAYNEYLLFNPMSNLLYPGDVIVGNSISNGKYLRVPGQKTGEVTWTSPDLTPDNPSVTFVRTIQDPKFSDFASTMQSWRATPQKAPGSVTTFEVTDIKDQRDFTAKLGFGIDTEDFKAGISWTGKTGNLKTHLLVKYVEKSYAITMDQPTPPLLKESLPGGLDGVLPVYISDIFYGRMGYALISTDKDYFDLLAALEIMAPSFKFELSAEYKEILDKAYTQFIIVGGQSGDHGRFVSEGWEGFREALAAPLTPSDAVPIAMTLRYADDNSVARVVQTGEFPITESQFVPDCDHLAFTFRPVHIEASAGHKKDLFVWGETTLTVPAEMTTDQREATHTLFSADKGSYIRMDERKQADLAESDYVTVNLIRPKGMSMEDFMKSEVTITTSFHNTNASGSIDGDDLGTHSRKLRIQDLLFSAIHYGFEMSSRRNVYLDYSATIDFDLFADNDDIEEVSGTLRAVSTDGTTTTRSLTGVEYFEN